MTTVIDVGCARYGGDYSIERLITEFKPEILYGFDPNPSMSAYGPGEPYWIGDTQVLLEQKAAWVFDGEVGYVDDGLNSWITDRTEEMRVKCIDLARFIREIPDGDIVLKMDCEGSEYDLLSHLMIQGVDKLLTLAWVEWHLGPPNAPERRRLIEREIECELKEWRW